MGNYEKSIYNIDTYIKCNFLIIFHTLFGKGSLDIKMAVSFLKNKCQRISELYFLPSLRAKLHIYSVFGLAIWPEIFQTTLYLQNRIQR